jgi:predicted Zn-dependent protease with MMP-like domain
MLLAVMPSHAAASGWNRWLRLAESEVQRIVRSLPASLREASAALPVSYQGQPNRSLQEEGIGRDTLGLFVGPPYGDEPLSASPLPAQIILFLENIRQVAGGDEDDFRREVATTYIHELGHYLGLNEDELIDRGLE